jgi:hypothetical protein
MQELKIMTPEDLEDVLAFEMARLTGEGIDREMKAWHAPWRREALEHYSKLGWSFLQRENGKVVGYVICQPILFYQSFTQTLWVEHVGATDEDIGEAMIEVAYRWARDKHLQKVYFKKTLPFASEIGFAKAEAEGELLSIKTTKM